MKESIKNLSWFFWVFEGKAVAMAEEIAVKRHKACDVEVVEDGKGSESNVNGLPSSSSSSPYVPVPMAEDGKPDGISAVIPGWFSEISPMWPGGFLFSSSSFVFYLAKSIDLASWYSFWWVILWGVLLIISFLCMVLGLEDGFCLLVDVFFFFW